MSVAGAGLAQVAPVASLMGPAGPLNPHGFPKPGPDQHVALTDPVAAAKANIALGDLRTFTVVGLFVNSGYSPGIVCEPAGALLESRGGAYVSDVAGVPSTLTAPSDRMEAYNRALAADAGFRRITGCRASTPCEERYRGSYSDAKVRDPACPRQRSVLAGVARGGTTRDLDAAMRDFEDGSPASRDALTAAFVNAVGADRLDNATALLRAGADVNGRAADARERQWLTSPLAEAFNNGDERSRMARATWLFDRGADFTNPDSARALDYAAIEASLPMTDLLLDHGASPNGASDTAQSDASAHADIRSAGTQSPTPFYTALREAMTNWSRRTAAERAAADLNLRKARVIAVRLYEAGGRFVAGPLQDEVRSRADLDVASIILAAAAREGRLGDLLGRWSENVPGPKSAAQGALDRRFRLYLAAVRRCTTIRPRPAGDHVLLCEDGSSAPHRNP